MSILRIVGGYIAGHIFISQIHGDHLLELLQSVFGLFLAGNRIGMGIGIAIGIPEMRKRFSLAKTFGPNDSRPKYPQCCVLVLKVIDGLASVPTTDYRLPMGLIMMCRSSDNMVIIWVVRGLAAVYPYGEVKGLGCNYSSLLSSLINKYISISKP